MGDTASTGSEPQNIYPRKRLIVCCDGTWNSGDIDGKSLTNVARITRCISDVDDWKRHKDRISQRNYVSQIVHYQPGVGMGTGAYAKLYDGITGRGISKAIREAYSFICLNRSSQADEIILIGFSRGAFTVRCVADFIARVGLLTKSGLRHLPRLFKMWKYLKAGDKERDDKLKKSCETLEEWGELRRSIEDKQIEVCAVWDTVSAVGFPTPGRMPDIPMKRYRTVGKIVPENIKMAIQALALDENRLQYSPMIWDPDQKLLWNQILIQRWFTGHHTDIGGGNKDMTLSNITLAWMIGQLTDKIQFDQSNLWAITTTRSWSKPSASDAPTNEPPDTRMRDCKVIATAPISPDLLQSEDSANAPFLRIYGGSGQRPLQNIPVHYSVRIFDYLKIASYSKHFPGSTQEIGQSLRTAEVLRDFESNEFEGDILERWAKHVLCAHVNIRQTRNSKEQNLLEEAGEELEGRLNEGLREEACYEALIPIYAILSAFHNMAKSYQRGKKTPLETFCRQVERQDPIRKRGKWGRYNRRDSKGKFIFKEIAKTTNSESAEEEEEQELELQVTGSSDQPFLVFMRVFPLLMGRCHELPKEEARQKPIGTSMGWNEELGGCEKCRRIWPGQSHKETLVSAKTQNTLGFKRSA